MKRKDRENRPEMARKKVFPEKVREKSPGSSKAIDDCYEEPEIPKMWDLKIKEENWFKSTIILYSSLDVIQKIKNKLTESQLEMFKRTCFGHFLDVNVFQFSGQVVHHMLLREVEHPNAEEMWFDISGRHLRFSINEFALITGLKCHEYPKITRGEIPGNRILEQFFPAVKKVTGELVDAVFHSYNGSNDEDCVKLAQLYLLENMLLGKEKHKLIALEHLKLVDHPDIFNNYPWGRVCYSFTLGYLQRALPKIPKLREKLKKNPEHSETYHLAGFPYALQVWAYESIPPLGKLFAEIKGSTIPRILNWGDTQQPNWKTVQKLVFAQDELQVVALKPTKLERKADYMSKVVKKRTPDKDHPKASGAEAVVAHSNDVDDEGHPEPPLQQGSSDIQFDIKQEFFSFRDEIRGVLISLKEEIIKINGQVASLNVGRVEMGKQLTNVVNTLYDIQSELKDGENRFKIHQQKRKILESSKDKGGHALEVNDDDDDDDDDDGDDNDDDTENEDNTAKADDDDDDEEEEDDNNDYDDKDTGKENYDDEDYHDDDNDDDDDYGDDNDTAKENEREKMQFHVDHPINMGVRGNQTNSLSSFVDYALNYAKGNNLQDKRRDNVDDSVLKMHKETNNNGKEQQLENVEQLLDKIEGHQFRQRGHVKRGHYEKNPALDNLLVEVPEKQDENPPMQEDFRDNLVEATKKQVMEMQSETQKLPKRLNKRHGMISRREMKMSTLQ